jgi:spermidine dehydrogenase
VGTSLVAANSTWLQAFGLPEPPFAPEKARGYYPPAKTGLRGSHDGSWEVAHDLRDGKDKDWAQSVDDGESYDLVVVGAGLSGLAGAYFYRKFAGQQSKILVLDNHDDFGGHAKRNEVQAGKRLLRLPS